MLTDEEIADISCQDIDMRGLLVALDEWYKETTGIDPVVASTLLDVVDVIRDNLI